jgi:peptidoglycan/xylan/chitin deacetylase (PgdA/CDA1 family)
MSVSAQLRRIATPLFRRAIGRDTALRFGAHRGRSLVLLYHRILPDGTPPNPIVPSVSASLFRRQVEALLRAGEVVPLSELIGSTPYGSRPRFALTFDDDHAGYVETVLPALRALSVPATFFLSGRTLHDLPPYWWTTVESSLRTHGFDFTRTTLGIGGRTIEDLAIALERSGRAAELTSRLPPAREAAMTAEHVRVLSDEGMTIGFHTLHHPVLTMESQRSLEEALTEGRRELASAAGAAVDLLAYPHGKADSVVAEAVERAGYAAAFAAGGRPIAATSDRFLLDRWEPGRLEADELATHVAMRLLRPPTSPRAMRQERLMHARTPTHVSD